MDSTKIITPEFRGSFVALSKPVNIKGESDPDKAKFQITVVLAKDDPFWKKIAKSIEDTAKAKFGKVPPKLKKPVKDGDESDYPEFADCYTLQAQTQRRPDVCDKALQPIIDADELYSGAWYRVSIRPYAWDHPTGGKGVSFALDNVMKIRDDDPLSGAGTAASDFANFAEEGEADALLD